MKKFKFSLETLMKVKRREEDAQKALLQEKRLKLLKLEDELKNLNQIKENEEKKFIKESKKGIGPNRILNFYNYFDKLKEQISITKSKIKFAQIEIEDILKELVEIKKSIKMLETLKEKKYEEYLTEVRLEESKIIEEFISTTKFARNAEAGYE